MAAVPGRLQRPKQALRLLYGLSGSGGCVNFGVTAALGVRGPEPSAAHQGSSLWGAPEVPLPGALTGTTAIPRPPYPPRVTGHSAAGPNERCRTRRRRGPPAGGSRQAEDHEADRGKPTTNPTTRMEAPGAVAGVGILSW